MSIKNILVYIDGNEKQSAVRLDIAIDQALKHEAHVTGLYVIPKIYVPSFVDAYIPSDFEAAQEKLAIETAQNIGANFKMLADKAGCANQWMCKKGHIAQEISQQSRYADLVILGQSKDISVLSEDVAVEGDVLLESARPILFVPYIGVSKSIGESVMVAWNGTHEAVRAIADAMPLLKKAQTVEVVAVNRSANDDSYPTNDICQFLAHHNVSVEARPTISKDISVADTLLSRAADRNTDLIIMGAYSHSRVRELIFGGVTDYMLKHMTVPVLMSH